MPYPKQFGQPCWTKEQAEKCTDLEAQVSSESAPLFLVTHSPIDHIKDLGTNKNINEQEAFQKIFSHKGEVRSVVLGTAGTGKSHLIRWLNLRAEVSAKDKEKLGLQDFKIVMVRRETGSVRVALNQIVDQLGKKYKNYLKDIQESINVFGDENSARHELLSALALEVGPRWEQRGNKPHKKDLKRLEHVIKSQGGTKVLCRDGGVIARTIDRFINPSSQEDREETIAFTKDEFPKAKDVAGSANSIDVQDFIEDVELEDISWEDVEEVLNSAFTNAKREMTGIKGSQLKAIFSNIRKELKSEGRQLAVFIEDVTAASGGLDIDLYKAFEPFGAEDMCRMIAVLGMTKKGWDPLPDSEKQRVQVLLDIGENAEQWSQNTDEVNQFTARYLNATRLSDKEINKEAKNSFSSDVTMSKCEGCPHIEECHTTFGHVELPGEVKIGLFPFSPEAPQKLLQSLDAPPLKNSPRGLLDRVLKPALYHSYDQFAQHQFPSEANFGVERRALTFWTEVESKFLGGNRWNNTHKGRARFLAEFWLETNSEDEAAAWLKPYQTPFNFPKFTAETREITPAPPGDDKPPSPPPTPRDNPQLNNELTKLEEWKRGGKLQSDSTYRKYLTVMISKAIRWQDHRHVPIEYAGKITDGTKPILIEDQTATPSNKYFLDIFRRNKKTKETEGLIEALVRFNREGSSSWNFVGGERQKRQVSRWIRKNQTAIVESIRPKGPELRDKAICAAVQFLAIAAVLRRRKPLPQEHHERIGEVLADTWNPEDSPKALSGEMSRIISNTHDKWEEIRDFVVTELGVGQGKSVPKDFIDPLPILKALNKFEETLALQTPPDQIKESYWQTRFAAVDNLQGFAELTKVLKIERGEIKERVDDIKQFLKDCGYNGADIKEDLKECVKGIIEIEEINFSEQESLRWRGTNDFQELKSSKRLQQQNIQWGASLNDAGKRLAEKNAKSTIYYDPRNLREAWHDLTQTVQDHLKSVEEQLGRQTHPDGKLDLEKDEGTQEALLSSLEKITRVMED